MPTHYKLRDHILKNYNTELIPRRSKQGNITVAFSIDLYQIIEVVKRLSVSAAPSNLQSIPVKKLQNEPHQQVSLNTWVIEVVLFLKTTFFSAGMTISLAGTPSSSTASRKSSSPRSRSGSPTRCSTTRKSPPIR